LKEADQAITDSLNYTRSLVAELAPPSLQEFGLVEGFGWLAEQMKTHGLVVSVQHSLQRIALPDDQAVLVFQSVRELLFNVLKHAGTGEADLSVESQQGELMISVTDRGHGFDPADPSIEGEERRRFGLFSVRERMAAMGGRLVVESQLRQGTIARLIFPYWPVAGSAELGALSPGLEDTSALSTQHSALQTPDTSALSTEHSALQQHARIRVLLVDDHAMVRQGLRSVLESYQDVSVVGEAGDGEEAIDLTRLLRPDVIVMDVNMAKLDGIEATRRIKAEWPSVVVVGLSFSSPSQIEPLLLQAGASRYVSKDAAGEQLYEAIMIAVKREADKEAVEKNATTLPGHDAS
jgi:CheY-like chemotaxis protein/anti-sigma regulatory factor (Ser/Thr protein kinase)